MKNKEKFSKEIVDIALAGENVAVDKFTMIPVKCRDLECDRCIRDCGSICDRNKLLKWAEAEYNEPRIDPRLYDAPVDTKILVSNDGTEWERRYFSNIKNDIVNAFCDGRTSFSSVEDFDYASWRYSKLYEGNKDKEQ